MFSVTLKLFHSSSNKNNWCYYGFFLCEVLNIVVVNLAFVLTNAFLDSKEWIWYGTGVISYLGQGWEYTETNPMCQVFPKSAMCQFYT